VYILALDISTSIIGYSIFSIKEEELIELNFIDLRKVVDDGENSQLFKKADYVIDIISNKIFNKYKIEEVIIETPLKVVFGTTIETSIILNKINSMIAYTIHRLGYHVKYIPSETARKRFLKDEYKLFKSIPTSIDVDAKKEFLVDKCFNLINDKFELKRRPKRTDKYLAECYDVVDSYILGKAYFYK